MEPHHPHHHQMLPPPPPSWYTPSAAPFHQQQLQHPVPFSHFPPRAPHPHPIPPWPPAAPDFTPAGVPPAPPSSIYHNPPPPYPSHSPRYPYPPPPLQPPVPPPPGQVWANSSWHQQGWDHSDRSFAYSNEDEWAARARAWAEAKSVMDIHSAGPLNHSGRMDGQTHYYGNSLQQTTGSSREIQQPPIPATHHLPYSTMDYQKPEPHLQESAQLSFDLPYVADTRASYVSNSKSLTQDKVSGTSPQLNHTSRSSTFEQEVPSSYSCFSENGNHFEQSQIALPSSVPLSQDTSQPAVQLQPPQMEMEQSHGAYAQQFSVSTDACDRPLVFEQRYAVDHHIQNQKINHNDGNITGGLGGIEHVEAAPSSHAWVPSVSFSQTAAVTQQFDSSYGNLSTVAGDHHLVFGRISGPSFPPGIPAVAPFGLGSGAPIHPSTAFSDEVNGAFGHVERPKKPSVPNWLREELIKKKASIASSAVDQPTIVSQSIDIDNDDRLFGKSEQVSKSMESGRSDEEEEEDEEDHVYTARSAAINQEIKRILTDVLLKVTDELFEEIATKVIDEGELVLEVNSSVNVSKVPSPSTTPKTATRVEMPLQRKSENVDSAKSSITISQGNLLGLANYNSDDEDEEAANSTITPVSMTNFSHQLAKDATSEDASGTIKRKMTGEEKTILSPENDARKASFEAALLYTKTSSHDIENNIIRGSCSGSVSAELNCEIIPEPSCYENKEFNRGKSSSTHMHADCGQTALDEDMDFKGRSGFSSRHSDKNTVNYEMVKDLTSGKKNGEDFVAMKNNNSDTGDKVKDRLDKQDNLQKSSEGHGLRKREHEDADLGDGRGAGKDKKIKSKDDDGRKREQAKNYKKERHGQVERLPHKSTGRRSPSPVGKAMNYKGNSVSGHANIPGGETPEDSKNRSRSHRRSLSRSPPRSRRRQVSRSPHSKHSQRRHSPYSYVQKRRKSRSISPRQHRR